MNKQDINYNKLYELKNHIEEIYRYFNDIHSNFINLIEDAECLDDEKFDLFHSMIKEYDSDLNTLKSNFLTLKSDNKKIESCFSQTKLLKKKRMVKLNSKMSKDDKYDDDIPF